MDLLIVRHAIAFDRDPRRWPDDAARPLTAAGVRRARRAARGLGRLADRPARLWTSSLARARQTAALLAEVCGWPEALECPALSPDAPVQGLLEALQGEPAQRIAIVGHQPGLGRLIAHCLPGGVRPQAIELKKCGVALLSFEGMACAGGARLRWLLAPGVLRAVR